MRTLTHKTTSLRLEFPRTWDPADLTGVTIQIADFDGNPLPVNGEEPPAAAPASLYQAATLEYDSRRYSRSIRLSPGAGALEIGDMVRIAGILGFEDHVVKGWDQANLAAELEEHVDRDFEAGASVMRLHADVTVDLSDTEMFPAGEQLVITWTPTGTGDVITEIAEIEEASQADVTSFTRDFKTLYKRAYKALTTPANDLDTMIRLAQDELRLDLAGRLLDIARIKDHTLISPPLMAKVAEMWARDGDKQTADEHKKYCKAYSAAFESLCRNPIWVDLDGDGKQDDGEVDTYPEIFEKVW